MKAILVTALVAVVAVALANRIAPHVMGLGPGGYTFSPNSLFRTFG